MVHFSAFRALKNGLVKPCARHDSNVRPLPPQGSALSPELRARISSWEPLCSHYGRSVALFLCLRVGVYRYRSSLRLLWLWSVEIIPRRPDCPKSESLAAQETTVRAAALSEADQALGGGASVCRHGELRALEWDDIDLAAGVIRVRRSMDARIDHRAQERARRGCGTESGSPGWFELTSLCIDWNGLGALRVRAGRSGPFGPAGGRFRYSSSANRSTSDASSPTWPGSGRVSASERPSRS